MHIKSLDIRDFRNLECVQLFPHERFNVISGLNGQGKTNLLEAIYWLTTLRPFRTNRLRELVRWKADHVKVSGTVQSEGLDHRLAVAVEAGTRVAYREGKKTRASQYFGALSTVLFTPDDVGLIRGAPDKRRRFIDRGIFTGRPAHLDDFLTYRRALDARNRLLRDNAADDLLDVYEHTLAQVGAQLTSARANFIEDLKPIFRTNLESILGVSLGCELKYRPSIYQGDDTIDAMIHVWASDRVKDRERGFTQKGPHADDLGFTLLGHNARNYASQGQQRAIVLALKLSEIQLLELRKDQVPVVLLDDVSSELDEQRNARLFDFLNSFNGQVFITTTDPAYLRIDGEQRHFVINAGTLTPQEI